MKIFNLIMGAFMSLSLVTLPHAKDKLITHDQTYIMQLDNFKNERCMRKTKGYYFLASPFNGSKKEKELRYNLSTRIAAIFLENHISLFAPILYNEAVVAQFKGIELAERRNLLMPMNMDLLLQSKGMILLKVEGWDKSWGISQYIDTCHKESINIYELEADNLEVQILSLIDILN